jgi:hypothetical protein
MDKARRGERSLVLNIEDGIIKIENRIFEGDYCFYYFGYVRA